MGFSFTKSEDGSAMIEAAIALPLFLIFVFGVIMIGHAIAVKDVIHNALENGARYAMMNPSANDTAIINEINKNVVLIKPEDMKCEISSGTGGTMKTRTISIVYKYKFMSGLFGLSPDIIKSEITFPTTPFSS